jgi:hypothetical protein
MRVRAYRLRLSDRDIDPCAVVADDAEAEIVSMVGSGLATNLRSNLGSNLRSDLPAMANPIMNPAVRSKVGRR